MRPGLGAVGGDLELLEAKIRPGVPADELEERRHLRLEGQLGHLGPRRGIRLHDAIGPGQHELPLGLLRRGPRDDHQVGPLRTSREGDVEVLRIGVRRGEEAASPVDPDPLQVAVVGAASLAVQNASLARDLDRVVARVEHHEWLAGRHELVGRTPADAPVAADDEVILDVVDRAHPLLVPSRVARNLARDRLCSTRGRIPEDSHAAEGEQDRQVLGALAARRGVEPGERHGDRRAVEGVVPLLVQDVVEADRPDREQERAETSHDRHALIGRSRHCRPTLHAALDGDSFRPSQAPS